MPDVSTTPLTRSSDRIAARSWFRLLTLASLALSLALSAIGFFLTAARALPLQDDFCRAAAVPATQFPPAVFPTGLIPSVVWTYNNWSGRWASIGLETVVLGALPVTHFYPVWIILIALVSVWLIYFAARRFGCRPSAALLLTALLAGIYWANMPSIAEGVFWVTGAIENVLSLALAVALLALLSSSNADRPLKAWRFAIAAALAFAAPGMHELVGLILVLVLTLSTAVIFIRKRPDRLTWLAICLIACLGFAIVVVAPGNAIRALYQYSLYDPQKGNIRVVGSFLKVSLEYLLPWLLDLKLWMLCAIVVFDPAFQSFRQGIPSINRKVAVGLQACILFLVVAGPIWTLKSPPPARTLDLISGVFLIGSLAVAVVVSKALPEVSIPRLRAPFLSLIVFLIAVLIAASPNNAMVAMDLISGRTQGWNAQLTQRFATLKASDAHSEVLVDSLDRNHPNSYFGGDIGPNPGTWSNRCVAQYFGVASVKVR
jgi:hypothetical protein